MASPTTNQNAAEKDRGSIEWGPPYGGECRFMGIQAALWLIAFKAKSDFVPHLRAVLCRLMESYKEDLMHLDIDSPEYAEARYLADLFGALALAIEDEEKAFDLHQDPPPGC